MKNKKGNYDVATVNKAILKVVSTQFKKDAKEEHRIVEEVGYSISKYYGSFRVENEKTNRYITYEFPKDWGYEKLYWGGYSGRKGIKIEDIFRYYQECKINFVGILDTPYNNAHNDYSDRYESKAIQRYKKLYDAKSLIKFYKENLESKKRELKKLEKDIKDYEHFLKEREKELEEIRTEIGLKNKKGE